MKKDSHHNEESVTKGYLDHTLRYRFGRFHNKIKKEIKEESHALEFKLTQRMDERFDEIEKKIDAQNEYVKGAVNKVLELADQVIGVHKNFEVEPASIKQNYGALEERVKNVELVVFPNQD